MSNHIIDNSLINKEITELTLGQLLNERGITYSDIRRLRKPNSDNIIVFNDSNETTEDDFKWIIENFAPRPRQTLVDYADEISMILKQLIAKPDALPKAV